MGDENRIEGAVRTAGGRLQDAVGGLTGNADMQTAGKVDELAGRAQQAVGAVADDVRDVGDRLAAGAQRYPIGALAVAGLFGFILGMMVNR